MFEYFKRKFVHLDGKIKINTYPQYYEDKNGTLIRKEADGSCYVADIDENGNVIKLGEYHG